MEPRRRSLTDLGQVRFDPKDVQEDAVKAFLHAADVLCRAGDLAQSELRYRQALRQAELSFGEGSDHAKQVMCMMIGFYRLTDREEEALAFERQLLTPKLAAQEPTVEAPPPPPNLHSRFLRRKEVGIDQISRMNRIFLPPDVRKACQVLGLPVDEQISVDDVLKAWKRQIVERSLHPDLGGEAESSVIVNTSKDVVVRWIESRLPRLGSKHFENSPNR